jgi:hypothetical protein
VHPRLRYGDVVARPRRPKSAQEALRARRAVRTLVTPGEAARREAARRRAQLEERARTLVAAWRETSRALDAGGKLEPALYEAVFAVAPEAYYATRDWRRRARAQVMRQPACEVQRDHEQERVEAYHLGGAWPGSEEGARQLLTLCDRCLARARKLRRDLGRAPTREEVLRIDPERPLYDAAVIAVLKARYARPPRAP